MSCQNCRHPESRSPSPTLLRCTHCTRDLPEIINSMVREQVEQWAIRVDYSLSDQDLSKNLVYFVDRNNDQRIQDWSSSHFSAQKGLVLVHYTGHPVLKVREQFSLYSQQSR